MLAKLKRRLGLAGSAQDALLGDLLTEAEQFVRAYTGIAGVLPAPVAAVQIAWAATTYHRLGAEGQTGHSEGGVSVSYDAQRDELKALLRPYRVGKVG